MEGKQYTSIIVGIVHLSTHMQIYSLDPRLILPGSFCWQC